MINPIRNVESWGVPVIPCGPFTMTVPSGSMSRAITSFREKWNPLESFPINRTLTRFLMISPKASVTMAR